MKALVCEAHGLPEALVLRDVALPQLKPGTMRVKVGAVGINFLDSLIIAGRYQVQPDIPFSPGSEVGGIVDAVADDVDGWSVGDRVAAMTTYGGLAEYVLVEASRAAKVPESMDLATAAGFGVAYGTAIHALDQRGRMQPSETLLVLGAAGGSGLAAVEVGKAMGARVIAAASSPEKCRLAAAHSADAAIDYRQEELRAGIARCTSGQGVDVIFDPVGGPLAEPAFRSLAPNGRHLVIGFAAGEIPSLPFNLALVKSASLVGVFWGAFTRREPDRHRANMEQLFQWHEEGKLTPLIDRRFTLAEGGLAIRHLMDRKAHGKVIVEI
ncbi:NADPH:quinone oxidoreductase [Croceicoccus estronivorus]|uniref:NADPH:quinone oxidoreductase family protein n=1 Tax=Croceicoccus estronivorus TaxID=1172626 RepID=UPI000834FC47|nr:NADPH:quinone oxidoreductase family protein [Croceicoccus estronivorus]OCC23511.1 NADPH:quinone oxidoreductase [Croceicoccus estronivorus]